MTLRTPAVILEAINASFEFITLKTVDNISLRIIIFMVVKFVGKFVLWLLRLLENYELSHFRSFLLKNSQLI